MTQKLNPEELRGLADDLDQILKVRPDLLKAEPAIRDDIESARDKAVRKYNDVTGYVIPKCTPNV